MPLVDQAPGVELETNGLHWKMSFQSSVLNSISNLIEISMPTASFAVHPPAPMWHWKYNNGKHYPVCKKCDNIAFNAHMKSKEHLDRCCGNVASFAFPGREELCRRGQFFLGPDGQLQRREPGLPPDINLEVASTANTVESSQPNDVLSFEIVEALSDTFVEKTQLPKKIRIRIIWSDGTETEDIFTHTSSGDTRHVFEAAKHSWMLKLEMPTTERNNCKNEWDLYLENDCLRETIPKCYGYAFLDGDNVSPIVCREVSIVALLVDEFAFTLDEAYRKMRTLEVSRARTTAITQMIMLTMTSMPDG